MPIRMVDDPDNQDQGGGGGGGRGGGGFGGLGSLLPLLLGFLIRKPKWIIPILIIGGIIYFWGGGCNMFSGFQEGQQNNSAFGTGGKLDPDEYAKSDIFNFLYDDNKTNPLPDAITLEQYCPTRGNQGAQGSCVAWSNAYSIRTILLARQTGARPDDVAFSPAFTYNQIKAGNNCQGAYINTAVENLSEVGAVPYNDFPYDPNDCSRRPSGDLVDMAQQYRIKGATRIAENPNGKMTVADIKQIKYTLNAGAPVAIGMMVGGSFMQDMMGKKVWHPTSDDYEMRGFGGHAMTVIGYDDNLEGGALQIMNSWGPEWGQNGLGWIRYRDFLDFNKEAYAYAPMGEVNKPVPDIFDVSFGLYNPKTKQDITLKHLGNGVFQTNAKVAPGTPFKIRFKNNIECYSYIFGQETDLSSYVLYPYTPKHSPYCGVTGTRVFPRDKNMTPDDKGTMDIFAVLISRKPLNFEEFNKAINGRRDQDYGAAIRAAAGDRFIDQINFNNSGMVSFTADAKSDKDVLIVIQVMK